jgi:DUF3102 family protein
VKKLEFLKLDKAIEQADNAPTPNPSNSLTDLAARIRAEHEATKASLKRGAEHAMGAGELLIDARKQVRHGEWLPWLRDHCAMPERTARLYMRLASNRQVIESQIGNVADFSIRGAVALISCSKKSVTANYARVTSDWAVDCFDLDAFEEAQADRNKRHEAFSDIDLILARLAEFGETTADVDSLGEQLVSAINECKDLLEASVAVHVPFDPCSDATAAILRAKDLAVEILRRVDGAA